MSTSASHSRSRGGCSWWCRHRHQGAADEGFTLIELVIVLVIIPIIIGGITVAMITTLKAADTRSPNDPTCKTDRTCAQSTVERLTESHDAQITSTLFVRDVQNATALETTSSPPLCGSPTQKGQVLGLRWSSGSNTVSVSYVQELIGISNVLERQVCSGASPQSNTTAAHNLSSATAASVTLACSSFDNSCATDAGGSSAPISALNVTSVTFTVTEASGFKYSVSASPRLLLGSTSGLVASTPPLLLGSAGARCGSGNGGITVSGVLAVNSSARGSIAVGRQGLTATQVYSQNTNTGSNGPVSGTYNSPTSYANGPALSDPLSILPAPSPSGAKTFVYNSPLTNASGGPGQDPSDPTHTKLLSGIFILNKGLSGSFASEPGGVFFYVTGGSVTFGGGLTQNLSAMSALTSPTYAGVLLYEVPSTPPSTLMLQGTPSVLSLNGVIDATSASVRLSGTATIGVLGLIASGITCSRNTSGVFGAIVTSTSVVSTTGSPSVTGQVVTYTAKVGVTPPGLGPATGNVEFFDGGAPIAACGGALGIAISGPGANCAVTYNAVGSHTITAKYLGGNFPASPVSTSITQTVGTAGTSTSVVSTTGSPSFTGQAVTYTATVAVTAPGSGTPTGNIEFFDGGVPIAACGGASGSALIGANATCVVTYTTTGNHTITAKYLGDGNYTASPTSSSIAQTVTTSGGVAGLVWLNVTVNGGPVTPSCSGTIGTTYSCTVTGRNDATVTAQVAFADSAGVPTVYSTLNQTINITTTGRGAGTSTLTIPGNQSTSSGTASAQKNGRSSAQITATFGSWTAVIAIN